VSQVTAGRKNRIVLEVAGTEGAMAWDSDTPNRLWIGHRDAPNQILERDPALLSPSARAISDYPGGHAEGFPDTLKQLFRTVYDAIAMGGAPPDAYPSFADGDREVRLCEAIARGAIAPVPRFSAEIARFFPREGFQSRLQLCEGLENEATPR
jgi:predicted dehydrogenase